MEMHQIRYFLALCAEKNFTRAARRCEVSQPSLTNAINRLETELGGRLFHRGRRHSRLTKLAAALQPHFEMIDQCARRARGVADFLLASPFDSTASVADTAQARAKARANGKGVLID